MAEGVNTITTRQKAEELAHTVLPLAGGATFESKVSLIAGYNSIAFLGISDQPFTVTMTEGCDQDNPFTLTQSIASSVDPNGNQRVCTRVLPCGNYVVIRVVNGVAPQSFLSFCALGIPA